MELRRAGAKIVAKVATKSFDPLTSDQLAQFDEMLTTLLNSG
jgi:hypothetical protein